MILRSQYDLEVNYKFSRLSYDFETNYDLEVDLTLMTSSFDYIMVLKSHDQEVKFYIVEVILRF